MDLAALRRRFRAIAPGLNERSRRLWAAAEAAELGHGGVTAIARVTGLAPSTISRGRREVEAGEHTTVPPERVRRPGGGRKPILETDPRVSAELERLVAEGAAGDPDSPLQWSSKSLRELAEELTARGHAVSHPTVRALLLRAGYRLQANRKKREGRQHPDRDAQFRYLAALVRDMQRRRQPVISVDTKKKELVGDFKNPGRTWRPRGTPEPVRIHDFLVPEQGKAIPYGVYDLSRNEGWVSVGIDHDTARFGVRTIARWWAVMGRQAYPRARALLITADAGGSNGTRVRLWKWELQQFANHTGLLITVCHYPPGTSKWNKIEHRLFSYIAMNWRGRPLVTVAAIVSLIAATRTTAGLRVRSEVDRGAYPKGIPISDAQLASLLLEPHAFHGEWNYTIRPKRPRRL